MGKATAWMTITVIQLLLLHTITTVSLTIKIANQHYNFTSHYTTLGPYELLKYKYNCTLLYASNITDDCELKYSDHTTPPGNSLLVIFGSLPNKPACASDVYGKHTAIARIAQASGFAGVITQSEELFYEGRIVGFDSAITIPFVVVSSKTLRIIRANYSVHLEIELPKITQTATNKLKIIARAYAACRIIGGIISGSLIFLIGYIIWVERFFLRKTRKIQWQSVALKIIAFINVLCSFLWIVVDPFGFSGMRSFPSALFLGIMIATFFAMTMFLLEIWALSIVNLGATNFRRVSIVLYSLSVIMGLLALFQGVFWFATPLRYTTYSIMSCILIFCGIGFVIIGRKMISVIENGKNMSKDQCLLGKISSFIICYFILEGIICVLRVAPLLGEVFSKMVAFILGVLVILCTFVILFLPSALPWRIACWRNMDVETKMASMDDLSEISIRKSIPGQ